MKKLVIVAGVLALASVASADLICEVVHNASPGAGLESYTVYFKGSTPGEYLSAVDIRFDGSLNQGWYYWSAKSMWLTTAWIGDFAAGESASWDCDTHLLVGRPAGAGGEQADYGVLIAQGTNEDLDMTGWTPGVTPTPDAHGYQFGLGTYLANTALTNMAFAIAAAWQTESVALAQVVLQSEAVLIGKAVANNGSHIDLNVVIPEPAALALLAMGAAGIVMRRKKRRA